MRSLLVLSLALATAGELVGVEGWMQQAFYPALLLTLAVASLGVPIPEDVPLIAAGVLLRTHPGIASWHGTILVALMGIMFGDLVLYGLGRRWGPGVVNHRSVRWMVPPDRFQRFVEKFHRHGAWFCFGGRFFMGVRAAMCLTAGATRFPYWRFFLADLAGAVLSVPFFVLLGYFFARMVPTLRTYLSGVQAALVGALVVAAIIVTIVYKRRRSRRERVDSSPPTPEPSVPDVIPPEPASVPIAAARRHETSSAKQNVGAGV